MDFVLDLSYEEKDFIQACVNKERWAQKKLYEDHYSMMMAVCLRYASDENEALDILHEGFIKVFNHIGKYKPGTSLLSWIKRIMINTAIDQYRKTSKRRTEEIAKAQSIDSLEPDVVSALSAREIMESLQHLTPAYRAVFNLYVIEGYSHKEVADILDITESTSRSNLVKARNKLKTLLQVRHG
ncbi:MAG TPA: RNA polymerase sigma factor [Saprospiraceae bacterium]|nr:RNA polymerase sigma factor [Saprospiraceae bacterium]